MPAQIRGSRAESLLLAAPLVPRIERVAALGAGSPTEIAGAEALGVAQDAEPARSGLPTDGDPFGLKDGAAVTVTPDDTGRDPVAGVLVAASDREVVIRRRDERVGDVHVHLPRAGYDVVPA